jgi:tetratricopeptide (TPR) repeat protein
LFVG